MFARFLPCRSSAPNVMKRTLHSQGCGVFGALGQGDSLLDSKDFQAVPILNSSQESLSISTSVTRISAGWGHSAALSTDGGLYVFGRPYDFSTLLQINRIRGVSSALARYVGRFTSAFGKETDGLYCTPIRIEGVESVVSVHCGAGLTVCRTISGEVLSFGQNRWGQCGIGDDKTPHIYQPVHVKLPVSVSSVDAGLQHCIAVSEKGTEVYCWGKGNRGQLGNASFEGSTVPILVRNINGLVVSVSAGFNHSAALTSEGHVYVWGKGMSDKLKSDTTNGGFSLRVYEDQNIPRKLTLPGDRKVEEICSSNVTLVMRCSDGSLWAMGMGEYDRNTIPNPIQVQQANPDAYEQGSTSVDGGQPDLDPPVVMPPGASLKRGFQRVAIVPKSSDIKHTSGLLVPPQKPSEKISDSASTSHTVFEVVVHAGEAYLKTKELIVANSTEDSNSKSKRIIDYSAGWMHSLLIIE